MRTWILTLLAVLIGMATPAMANCESSESRLIIALVNEKPGEVTIQEYCASDDQQVVPIAIGDVPGFAGCEIKGQGSNFALWCDGTPTTIPFARSVGPQCRYIAAMRAPDYSMSIYWTAMVQAAFQCGETTGGIHQLVASAMERAGT